MNSSMPHNQDSHTRQEIARLGYEEQKELLPKWHSQPSQLEKNDCSRLHLLCESFVSFGDKLPIKNSSPLNITALKEYKVFVVQHDWAKAFEGASDYAVNNTIRIPFDRCAFEFRISGQSVIVLTDQSPTNPADIRYLFFVHLNKTWSPDGCDVEKINGVHQAVPRLPTGNEKHLTFAIEQIKAICVALDAQVAVHEVIRAPHKLNEKRVSKGRVPLFDYHVVDLSRRARTSRPENSTPTGRHVRLHFRRGHWRHYTNHKSWIHWMLVGNPDLGWIDKEYRL